VNNLPQGSVSVTVHGTDYFKFGGAYYQAFFSGGEVTYQIVANPTS
jgi:hypothetical protein